jgi:hypothetical protein
MYNKKARYKLLSSRMHPIRLPMRPLKIAFAILALEVLSITSALSFLTTSITIKNSGTIATILPLHTEGKYIKDSFNNTVYLRGLWAGSFVDTSTGWWDVDASKWNETALRYTLQQLRDVWHVNCINTFIWGDWWLGNNATTLNGGTTDIGCRDAIIRTIQVAQDYGIYIQLRLYGCNATQNRVEGQPYQPFTSWTVQDFVDFWVNVTTTLKDYPNVIFHLFDEPGTGGGQATMQDWFNAANQTIAAIRNAGVDHLIAVHWGYCGDMMWVADWINRGYPTHNILFSEHIYRSLGSFCWNTNYPVDIESIRACLNSTQGEPQGTATKYIMDTYNVPVWVSAIGTLWGHTTNDDEYIAFWNTLQVLNEWNISYVAYTTGRTQSQGALTTDPAGQVFAPPNRVGQALINAILGVPPPPIHTLTVNSYPLSTTFTLNGTQYQTNCTKTRFEGTYVIQAPASITSYTHHILIGNASIDTIGGYWIYTYSSGPFALSSPATVNSIYFYAGTSGKVKIALYNSSTSTPKVPTTLIVASSEVNCPSAGWILMNITSTSLSTGEYFFVVKINTNGMLAATSAEQSYTGPFMTDAYSNDFPATFNVTGYLATPYFAAYIPTAPFETSVYNFVRWEDNSTNPERTINLTTNMNLTAIYQPAT